MTFIVDQLFKVVMLKVVGISEFFLGQYYLRSSYLCLHSLERFTNGVLYV